MECNTEGNLLERRTLRIVILLVSAALAALGLWKRSQDLDELAFVQAQVKRANSTDAPMPSAAVQQRLQRDHRNALLTISQQERALRERGSTGATAASLESLIEHTIQQMVLSASSGFSTADTAWLQFEDSRVHEVRTALAIDLVLLPVSVAGLIGGSVMWFMDSKRKRGTPLESPPK